MTVLRSVSTGLMSRGVISSGWYSVLTGAALLIVAYALGSVAEDDAAAPYVAVIMAVVGMWQLVRGVRSELRRRTGD